ncbi:MAG: glutathione peroxidase [Bacteroidetes bacterium]|nr:glutathione peroxidase [Bacteroidota bacterium]MDA1242392.1 glutathione peroxidase [Bacteroidota bacterium]
MKLMMNTFLIVLVLVGVGALVAWKAFNANHHYTPQPAMASFHDLVATTLEGDEFAFDQLAGKRVLIVNTASKCGFTPQYESLETLHQRYGDQGLVILGFPCNQFGKQEPGSSDDIRSFCSKNYGVSFQMMEKIDVKGDNQHSVYAWLTRKELNGAGDHSVRWNFHKFLVNEQGELVAALGSGADPLGDEILSFAAGR